MQLDHEKIQGITEMPRSDVQQCTAATTILDMLNLMQPYIHNLHITQFHLENY